MNGCFHGVQSRKFSLSIIGIFSGSVLGYFVLMACIPAESVRNSCQTTSPGRSIWLVSQFSNISYDDFCSTHLNDKGTCSVQSIQTVSVPRIVSSKYKFNAGSRTNLIVIKPEKCKINEQKQFLKLGLLNIRSLTPKAVIVNEIITDNSFDVLCLTETWLKTNDYFGLNESTPPSYCYKHEPRETGRGGGVATIYSDILNVTQKTGYRFDSFEILMLNVKLSDKQNKSVLSLALATVYRPPGPYTDFLK